MKVTIEYGGKRVEVELTIEQIKELGLQEEKKTGWERAELGKAYAHIDSCMQLTQEIEDNLTRDYSRYQNGNYFTNADLAVKMLKRVRLMLKMQRWVDEHNEPLDWDNGNTLKYRISYNNALNELRVSSDSISNLIGVIYFSSYELAEQAIEEFGDEIIECYVDYVESEGTKV